MREIEIKTRVASLSNIVDTLRSRGVDVSDPVTQHDTVYGAPGVDGDNENTAPWLRIRRETKNNETTVYFTLKRSITNQLDSIEHETTVGDEIELENIIEQLGFVQYSDLTKTRQQARIDGVGLCFDDVKDAGTFIEAEKLTSDDVSYDSVVEELWQLVERIGGSRDNAVTDGYDVLVNKATAAK